MPFERRVARTLVQEGADGPAEILAAEQRRPDVGRALIRSERRPGGEALREAHRLLRELVVREHAVDHVPALEGGSVVEVAAHDELPRAGRPRAFGHALRAAPSRSSLVNEGPRPRPPAPPCPPPGVGWGAATGRPRS